MIGDFHGYKWAKWIDRIEIVNGSYRGYWESVTVTINVGAYINKI